MRRTLVVALALLATLTHAPARGETDATSCTVCHSDADLFEGEDLAVVEACRDDVHAFVGLSCHDCHGGNPDPALADDADAAMDEGFGPAPFAGVPPRQAIPGFCGRCHSDFEYMKRFRPDARVDQEREYWTSYHGAALRNGDLRVAVCSDCHGAHGVRRADDPKSSVYPTRVAGTCGACHEDPERMAATRLADGSPIPVDQVARWRESVHGRALMDRGDLFSPTCNDCHGNHGAMPPDVESVTFVCGRCHGREAELLRASAKHDGFVAHNELLAEEPGGCAACHEAPDPAAALVGVRELGQCTACHGNHSVARASNALLSALPDTPCALCHGEVAGAAAAEPADRVERFVIQRDALLAEAAKQALEGEARYDWLVGRMLELPFHTRSITEHGEPGLVLRPEFERLFRKFRLGTIRREFTDPATGERRTERVRRCSDCHAAEPALADDPVGLVVAAGIASRLQELETLIARAERTLLVAKRGGVEVGEAGAALDEAIDSQIELQVLVHAFSVDEGGEFVTVHEEGMTHAQAALEASHAAVRELSVRRRGLFVSLGLILLVLIGLGATIRQRSHSPAGA